MTSDESVCDDELLSQDGDGCLLDGVDAGGAGPSGEHAEDAGARADVEDDVPGRTTASIAARKASVRTRSWIIDRCTSNSAYIGSGEFLIGVRIGDSRQCAACAFIDAH